MNPVINIQWSGDAASGHLKLLDQTQLPEEISYLDCRDVQSVWDAIKRLSVRGAPAIGIAAAFGCVVGAQQARDGQSIEQALNKAADHLATSRPTAVNLFWALNRMKKVQPCTLENLLQEAKLIHQQDERMCRQIGEHALPLIKQCSASGGDASNPSPGPGVLTHCNAGALATGGIGTATAPMYLAHEQGLAIKVYADETRPLLQGSRLTAFELAAAGIDVTLICDDMAGQVMREGRIGMVITGADRIAANGDAANKIGTYSLAVLAHHHKIPFYVAAPSTTFDMSLADGEGIPIEERASDEITQGFGKRTAPQGVNTYSPAFDVTPHELIDAIVTEKGLIQPVNADRVREVLGGAIE
jgi:methylthioribose-1-phosphate isomerase